MIAIRLDEISQTRGNSRIKRALLRSRARMKWQQSPIDGNLLLAAANLFRRMGATEVFVFGSATKGALRPDSDVDMAVTGLPPKVYFSAITKLRISSAGRSILWI